MELRDQAVTPHVAQNQSGRRSAIDGPYHPPSRLRDLAAHPQAHRGARDLAMERVKKNNSVADMTRSMAYHPEVHYAIAMRPPFRPWHSRGRRSALR